MMDANTHEKLRIFKNEILPLCTSAETSYKPEKWSSGNPLYGHCSLISFFLQKQLGGKIVRCQANINYGNAREPGGRTELHYLNEIDNNKIDIAGEQYIFEELGGNTVSFGNYQERPLDRVLDDESTKARYAVFEERLIRTMQQKKFSFAA